MLLLTRKVDQAIFVGDSIVITVCQIDGNQVKIGIDAPHEISILREELLLESQDKRDDQ